MATLILVRHARSEANAVGILTGRTPGVALDPVGREQAQELSARLADLPVADMVSSPLQRCLETARALQPGGRSMEPFVDERITECDYGSWQGRTIWDLRDEPLWDVVQKRPSEAVFPGGESLVQMQARALDAVRDHEARISRDHGPAAVWVMVSHGDVIKSVLADALGTSLDRFQRIHVDPASVSVVTWTGPQPRVWCVNTHAGSLAWLGLLADGEAVPGGGAGPTEAAPGSGGVGA